MEKSGSALSKVPEVTLFFWILKVAATTLGETGGDSLSMSMHLGYLLATAIFAAIFVFAVSLQIRAPRFQAMTYWLTIVATTTVGTTIADFVDRSLGVGYAGGSSILFVLLLASLVIWFISSGSVAVNTINNPKTEMFYWITIMFSQTLGTALGDWTSSTVGIGYGGGAVVFVGLLSLVAALYYWTKISRTFIFWAAFILTRPLGATVGDLLDKPIHDGGMALSRYGASGVLAIFMLVCIFAFPRRAAQHAH